jgi:hypothetical protein
MKRREHGNPLNPKEGRSMLKRFFWGGVDYVTPPDDLCGNKKGSQKEAQPSPTFIVGYQAHADIIPH